MFWVFPHQLPAPRLGFLQLKPSLSCCLPAGPCCVTLEWVAKEGQAPHLAPATKTVWKTQKTWAGIFPPPRSALLLLKPAPLSCCYNWSWNTFQQGAAPAHSSDQGRKEAAPPWHCQKTGLSRTPGCGTGDIQ